MPSPAITPWGIKERPDGLTRKRVSELSGSGPLDIVTRTQKGNPRVRLVSKHYLATETNKWKYMQGSAPSNWNTLSFDDSSWSTAATGGEFGFGDGDEATVLSSGHSGYYFRRKLTLASGDLDASQGDVLELRMVLDGGVEVYLHGGSLLSPALIAYIAAQDQTGTGERKWRFLKPNVSSLAAGNYVLSAKVTQASGATDLSFWGELVVRRPAP